MIVTIHANLNEGNTGETFRELFKLRRAKSVIKLPNNLGRLVGGTEANLVGTRGLILTGPAKVIVAVLALG